MSNISNPWAVEYAPHLLDRVAARIAPFFAGGSGTMTDAQCRDVARQTVVSFRPVTGKELQLAAEIVALEMAGLDCLSCAAQVPADQPETMLKMQEDAIKLHTIATKLHRQIEARQRERSLGQAARPETRAFDEADFNVMMSKARTVVTFARAKGEASRVAQDLAATASGDRRTSAARRRADQAWAEELQNLSSWVQQTRH